MPKRSVRCTYCASLTEVSARAISVVCPACNKRLNIENYQIQRYHPVHEIRTCGNVVVEKRGHVPAPILADNLVVRGQVDGDVTVMGSVSIDGTGQIHGDVRAAILAVSDGGVIDGFVRVGASDETERIAKRGWEREAPAEPS